MSVDFFVPEMQSQTDSIITLCNAYAAGIQNLKSTIEQTLINQDKIDGEAYQAAKEYFTQVYSALSNGLHVLSGAIKVANTSLLSEYQTQVDTNSLQSETLENQIQQLSSHIDDLRQIKNTIEDNQVLTYLLTTYILNLENIKQKLTMKLQKLLDYNTSSPAIFTEVESLIKDIQQGINQVTSGAGWDANTNRFILQNMDMSWTKSLNEKYLKEQFPLLLNKIPNLMPPDLLLLKQYATMFPDEETPPELIEYFKNNYPSELKNEALPTFLTLLSLGCNRIGGMLNLLGSIPGPDYANTFVIITNGGQGRTWSKFATKLGSWSDKVGYALLGVGFATGMYNDWCIGDKSFGEAFMKNGTLAGVSWGTSAAITAILGTNPAGWAVIAGAAVGVGIVTGVSYLYDINFLGMQDGLDWVGGKIDDGLNWAGEKLGEAGEALSDFGEAINPFNWF